MYGLRSAGLNLNPQGSNVTQFGRKQQAAMAKSAGPYGQFVVVAEDQCKIAASKLCKIKIFSSYDYFNFSLHLWRLQKLL